MLISKRLLAIADYVENGASVCDIGTDHAYLPIYLAERGIASKIIATDINEKPLSNAKKNICNSRIKSIELRLCDGLAGISAGEVDTVIIAGMGGGVISSILEKGAFIASQKGIRLILQPTTSPDYLRRFLYSEGYEISEETPISENGKLYSVILAKFTGVKAEKPESFYYIGKVKPDCDAGLMYIKKQQNRCFECFKSLEKIDGESSRYLQYKSAYSGIEEYLKSFGVKNGI